MSNPLHQLEDFSSACNDVEEKLVQLNIDSRDDRREVAKRIRQHLIEMMSSLEQTDLGGALSSGLDAFDQYCKNEDLD